MFGSGPGSNTSYVLVTVKDVAVRLETSGCKILGKKKHLSCIIKQLSLNYSAHWILVVIDVAAKTGYFMDPQGNSPAEHIKELFNNKSIYTQTEMDE
ncbi:hypothetical protein CUMW_260390, partial [Citrus unshiu]